LQPLKQLFTIKFILVYFSIYLVVLQSSMGIICWDGEYCR